MKDLQSTLNCLSAPLDFNPTEVATRISLARDAVAAVEAAQEALNKRVALAELRKAELDNDMQAGNNTSGANNQSGPQPASSEFAQTVANIAATVSAPQMDVRQSVPTSSTTHAATPDPSRTMSQVASGSWTTVGPKKKKSNLQRGKAPVNREVIPNLPTVVEEPKKVGVKVVLKPNFTVEHLKDYAQYDATIGTHVSKMTFEPMYIRNNEQHLRVVCENWDSKEKKGAFWEAKFWPDFCQVDKWRRDLNQVAWKPFVEPKNYFTIVAEGLHTSTTTEDVFRHVDNLYNHDENVKVEVRQRPSTPTSIRYQTTSFVIRVRSVDENGNWLDENIDKMPRDPVTAVLKRDNCRVRPWMGALPGREVRGPVFLSPQH